MTASDVLESTTTYCHVDVTFSKKVKTLGVSESVLGWRLQGSAGGILLMLARDKEYGKAMECFERSSSAGDIEAARNAEELGKVLEQL